MMDFCSYRLANEVVAGRLGGLHSARCVLVSVDFVEVEKLQASARWDEAGALLARAGKHLADAAAAAVQTAAAGVVLGCTETEQLIGQADSAVPIFPTTRSHVEAAVNRALTDRGLTLAHLPILRRGVVVSGHVAGDVDDLSSHPPCVGAGKHAHYVGDVAGLSESSHGVREGSALARSRDGSPAAGRCRWRWDTPR